MQKCSQESSQDRQVDNFLNRSETYTKFKQTRNRFPRLKVQSFRLNEIWSVDLADMQKLSRYNHGINFIFIAVDALSRFVWAVPMIKKTASECKNALQKIMEALRARKNSSTEMMKPKFCRPNSKSDPKSEKIWIDKGREFASEFSQCCRDNDIDLYSTYSETNSAFAERNIRSLKAKIPDTYIENLQQFVIVVNCRVNRITKLAPKDVEKSDVPYLISLQTCNQFREPKYKIGQRVRIKRKIETFHRGYRIQFTDEVFTITALQSLNPPTYTIKDANNQLIQGNSFEPELTLFEK